jgi:soluble lytic murein transglycosylase
MELEADPTLYLVSLGRPSAAARASLGLRAPAQLAKLMCELGQPASAQPLFRHLGYEAAADEATLSAVVELARSCRRADLVLAATRGAAANGGQAGWEAFPLPTHVGFGARPEGMPEPALLLALARQESLFDPAARSPAGALGLMQVMPATAQGVSRDFGLAYSKARLLGDPEYNIQVGGLYLQAQLARFGGETALALAAYNAGPSRVARWIEAYGDPRRGDRYDLIDWIERIPFAETRNYVQRVLEGRAVYRMVLAGAGPGDSPRRAAMPFPAPKPES